AILLKNIEHANVVTDVGNNRHHIHRFRATHQLLVNGEDAVFAFAEKQQLLRLKSHDLTAQLAADRSAGAGNQHSPTFEVSGNRGTVQLNRFASQQILQRDFAQLAAAHAPVYQLKYAWQDARFYLRQPAHLDNSPDLGGRCGRHGDDHLVDEEIVDQSGQVGSGTKYDVRYASAADL